MIEFETPEKETPSKGLRQFAAEAVNHRSAHEEYRRHLSLPNAIVHPDGVIEIREEITGVNQ